LLWLPILEAAAHSDVGSVCGLLLLLLLLLAARRWLAAHLRHP
jgi:hypothetical protein